MPYFINGLIIVLWLLLASYCLFSFALKYFWDTIPLYKNPSSYTDFISIVIPVRNEEENIQNLLNDISAQNFPASQLEVLVIDDSSTDKTVEIVKYCSATFPISIRLIQLPDERTNSPKKRAIEKAIPVAKGNLIVTTDGDCRVGTGWLTALAAYHQATGAKLMSGPVTFLEAEKFTDQLQIVEFSSLIGSGASSISAGSPSMCNGANLCYEKEVFLDVNGYEGVRHIASGDDEFLMHKVANKYPGGVHFVKSPDATVQTEPHRSWNLFFRQRKRWASKWKHYQSKTPLLLALYIFSCNAALLVSIVLWLSAQLSLYSFLVLIALKYVPEWIFLGSILRFLEKDDAIPYIPLTQLFYPFYVCFFGLVAQSSHYEWKGRKLT